MWFKLLAEPRNFQFMNKIFLQAMDKGNPLDVTLLLTAIKCGLYSQDFESAKTTVALLMRVSEAFASLKSKPHHSVIS